LHGLDSQNPEVGFPTLELEEQVVIKAQPDGLDVITFVITLSA